MNITRRALLSGAAGITLAGGLGCAPGKEAPVASRTDELPGVTVGLTYIPNVQFSAFYVGVDEGIFHELGVDVTLRHHGAQEDVFGALINGKEQVVFATSDEAVVAAQQTPKLRTFATAMQKFPGVVIAPAAAGAKDLTDLRGTSIGIPGHFGSTYYAALVALHNAGMTEDDVKLTDVGFTQVAALEAGKVDAIVGYTNNDTVQCRLAGLEVTEIPVQEASEPTLVGPGLITMDEVLSEEILASLAQGMAEAERRIVADPDLALEATARQVPTLSDPDQREAAREVLAATMKLWQVGGEVSVAIDQQAFERMGEFLVEAGIMDSFQQDPYILL